VDVLRARYRRETSKVPWLAGLLTDEPTAVRALAAAAIGSIGRTSETGGQKPEPYREANRLATPALLVALADPDHRVRKEVVRALGEFDDPAVVAPLEKRAETEADPDVRAAAARGAEAVRKRAERPTP
jgi:HEAT repeat protein